MYIMYSFIIAKAHNINILAIIIKLTRVSAVWCTYAADY